MNMASIFYWVFFIYVKSNTVITIYNNKLKWKTMTKWLFIVSVFIIIKGFYKMFLCPRITIVFHVTPLALIDMFSMVAQEYRHCFCWSHNRHLVAPFIIITCYLQHVFFAKWHHHHQLYHNFWLVYHELGRVCQCL